MGADASEKEPSRLLLQCCIVPKGGLGYPVLERRPRWGEGSGSCCAVVTVQRIARTSQTVSSRVKSLLGTTTLPLPTPIKTRTASCLSPTLLRVSCRAVAPPEQLLLSPRSATPPVTFEDPLPHSSTIPRTLSRVPSPHERELGPCSPIV